MLSEPLIGLIGLIITLIVSAIGSYHWVKSRRYKPAILDAWAQGAILYTMDEKGRQSKIPCIYIYLKLDPKDEIIHNCEVQVKNGWFAYFDSGGYMRYDVQREENLHLGRYEIDVANEGMQFLQPRWEASIPRPYGGWLGLPTELKTEKLTLVISGEVKGKCLKSKIDLNINVKDLLSKRKWPPDVLKEEKQLVDIADKVIDKYLATLTTFSRFIFCVLY